MRSGVKTKLSQLVASPDYEAEGGIIVSCLLIDDKGGEDRTLSDFVTWGIQIVIFFGEKVHHGRRVVDWVY